MAKVYKSDAMAAIHETMEGLFEIGAIDKQTMREFDEGCLTAVETMTRRKSAPFGSVNLFLSQFFPAISM